MTVNETEEKYEHELPDFVEIAALYGWLGSAAEEIHIWERRMRKKKDSSSETAERVSALIPAMQSLQHELFFAIALGLNDKFNYVAGGDTQ